MPRNGSGVYSADWVNASPNTTIESAKQNAMVADLVADANAARPITAGGTGETTARLKDGTWRFQNTADTTKLLAFDLSGLTAATTLTVKVPNGQPVYGQCYLALDGANLRLSPRSGNLLTINGYGHQIPDAGVALAPTSLSASTVYYIYAYMNAGTMTLEASTTAFTLSGGFRVKSGDATRTFVGWARTSSGVAWFDDVTTRHVISFYNPKPKPMRGFFTANRATTSTSMASVNSEIRLFLLAHSDYACQFSFNGGVFASAGSIKIRTAIAADGTALDSNGVLQPPDTGGYQVAASASFVLSEATAHTIDLFAAVSLGTATFQYEADAGGRGALTGIVWG